MLLKGSLESKTFMGQTTTTLTGVPPSITYYLTIDSDYLIIMTIIDYGFSPIRSQKIGRLGDLPVRCFSLIIEKVVNWVVNR